MENEIENKSKADRRQQKKDKKKFRIDGGSLRVVYQNAIRRRLGENK